MSTAQLPGDFCSALQAVSAAALVYNAERILFANSAMLRLLGYEQEALLQMPPYAWAALEFADDLRRYGERCLAEDGNRQLYFGSPRTSWNHSCAIGR